MPNFPSVAAALQAFNAASGQNLTQQNWGATDAKQMPQWAGPGVGQQTGQGEFNSWLANIAHAQPIPGYTQPAAAPKAATPTAQQAVNPYQPTYLGNPTQGVATSNQAANAGAAQTLDPNLLASLGAGATVQDLQQSFAPATATANANLNAQLAAAGISGGGAVDATQQLAGQLQASQDPALAAAIQNSQANMLNAGQYDTSAINSQNQYNAGLQQQSGLANQSASNAMTMQNLQQLLAAQTQNANYANNSQTDYAAALQNAYYQQQNQFNTINNAGLSGQQGVTAQGQAASNGLSQQYGNAYGTTTPSGGYQQLGTALGNAFAPKSSSGTYGINIDGVPQ